MRFPIALLLSVSMTACANGPLMIGGQTSAPAVANTGDLWFDGAQTTLAQRKGVKPITGKAKNVILFIADGMDPTTVAAARIYDGQSRGEEGEENLLFFERFPHLAMSKTYNTDMQVPDSAGTASAMMTGYKTRVGHISVKKEVPRSDCEASINAHAPTILEIAEQKGLSTGVVSTARLTHATPAATYAHVPDRDWESDSNLPEGAYELGCRDIASQLIDFPYGDGVDIALGGGRGPFMTRDTTDPEDENRMGWRKDGRNLTAEWVAKSDHHSFVWNKEQFDAIDPATDPRVLGLFENSHMEFEADRANDKAGEPSLEEMTRKAIEVLSRNENGFVLMVEGGKVDHAHHAGNAARALIDAQEYAQAVAAAREMTNERDTLIIVTADHGHTLTFAGYPGKGNDILGLVRYVSDEGESKLMLGEDGKPYTTLGYANGPGSVFKKGVDLKTRPIGSEEEVKALDYLQPALVPTGGETHGGQDVTIYASGPDAYLFTGVVEQNYIFHVMMDALRINPQPGE
ncbi:alkaline phosphatase [Hyphococcus sp.]|uniref:alkaline phosphatase n=1 Tax=Hyphococcus sp. TaxID=2038636 RepID=UPI00208C03A8|nr:MAG: alkaline phosphatase [Marinicaulis sp.]